MFTIGLDEVVERGAINVMARVTGKSTEKVYPDFRAP